MILFIILIYILILIYTRLSRGITKSSRCLVGKTAIVTGANSGIGYQTVLNLASRRCRVIMADVADMEDSKIKIIKYTNNSNIIAKHLDLSSLKSVRDFAEDIKRSEERLDILINNAGILHSSKDQTIDGLNPVMQVNYFGHFLLTHLLIDLLKKSARSRIIFTSSVAIYLANLSLENFSLNKTSNSLWEKFLLYSNSKLAILIASDLFAEKLKNTGVTCNSCHPGFVGGTQMSENFFSKNCVRFWSNKTYYFGVKDVWGGSQVLIHLAVSNKLSNATGKYFSDCQVARKPRILYDKEFCKGIWEASERYVGLSEQERL